ncbi:hypothetical protein CRG98_015009 [Punica granatum]|nr:hypothetical protein CRG98_015009 [Punica granatum]
MAGDEEGHPHHTVVFPAAIDSIRTCPSSESTTSPSTLLVYNLSVLRNKVHQVQSLVTLLISPDQAQAEPASTVVSSMGTLIQEIIFTASSMMFTCQQMVTTDNNTNSGTVSPHFSDELLSHNQLSNNHALDHALGGDEQVGRNLYPETGLNWYNDNQSNVMSMTTSINNDHINSSSTHLNNTSMEPKREAQKLPQAPDGRDQTYSSDCDIIELDATELLAKYTHYCSICGKGFKRDANLRMHMRAHGDEYKSSSALSNPLKKRTGIDPNGNIINNDNEEHINDNPVNKLPRKYSCPHEGCRWNQRHTRFQPLKSMICVKNHYKRSHCPKLFACKQCNAKQFSVLSDLRTHEKHCGDIKWQCSCGTTFSRKDKLMGHVALFRGHSPMVNLRKPAGNAEQLSMLSMQIGDRQGNL